MNFGINLGMNTGFRGLKPASQGPKKVEEQKRREPVEPKGEPVPDTPKPDENSNEQKIADDGLEKNINELDTNGWSLFFREDMERLKEEITKSKDVYNKYFNS